jgi:GDSL-like Lipase/Acylhydrolase family
MSIYNRRNVIANILIIGGLFVGTQGCSKLFGSGSENNPTTASNQNVPIPSPTISSKQFQMLTIGDSVMWGQGLENKDKFRTKVKVLISEKLGLEVNLVNLSHSGATTNEPEKPWFKKKETDHKFGDPNRGNIGEIPASFPTVFEQLKISTTKFTNPDDVDLVLVDGGINDMNKLKLLITPSLNDQQKKNIEQFKEYCGDKYIGKLMSEIKNTYPNARIIVTGYFPLISTGTNRHELFNVIAKLFGENKQLDNWLGLSLKWIQNNLKIKGWYYQQLIKNSENWYQISNQEFENQVTKLNAKEPLKGSKRAFFAKVGFDAENSYAAEKTYLWKLQDRTRVDDSLYKLREGICEPLKNQYIDFDYFACHRAALFHPNIDGANAYFESIKTLLEGNWDDFGWKN